VDYRIRGGRSVDLRLGLSADRGRTLGWCALPSGAGPGLPVLALAASKMAHWSSGSARAVDGQATAAALAAVAPAFGVRRREVTLVAGASSRMKIVDVAGADPAVLDRLLKL
jgi:Uncharacterised ACR, YggU family COG1872